VSDQRMLRVTSGVLLLHRCMGTGREGAVHYIVCLVAKVVCRLHGLNNGVFFAGLDLAQQ
jgi:hypothetical protein